MAAVEEKSITFSWSPDGTATVQDTFTPNAGEIWYVDAIFMESDGSGTNGDSYALEVLKASSNQSLGNDPGNFSERASVTVVDNNVRSQTSGVNAYITEANTLYAITGSEFDASSGATFYVTIHLRRVA